MDSRSFKNESPVATTVGEGIMTDTSPDKKQRLSEMNERSAQQLLQASEKERQELRKRVERLCARLTTSQENLTHALQPNPELIHAVAPYMNVNADIKSVARVLSAFQQHDREFGWSQNYFFKPLNAIERHSPSGTAYIVFRHAAREMDRIMGSGVQSKKEARPPDFTIAQIEAVVYELARKPAQYQRGLASLRKQRSRLRELRYNGFPMNEAFPRYAKEIRDHMRAYHGLDEAERDVLEERLRFGDDPKAFDMALATRKIPDLDGRYRSAHAHIKQIESGVNLRLFKNVPQDLVSFIEHYRAPPL